MSTTIKSPRCLELGCGEAGLEHWRLTLNFFATRAKLHHANISLGCAATCSSYFADTNSHFVTLPRAKKTGAHMHGQAHTLRQACTRRHTRGNTNAHGHTQTCTRSRRTYLYVCMYVHTRVYTCICMLLKMYNDKEKARYSFITNVPDPFTDTVYVCMTSYV